MNCKSKLAKIIRHENKLNKKSLSNFDRLYIVKR